MLKNKKVFAGKHSKEIQEKAFELGWRWKLGETKVINENYPFLYFTTDQTIDKGNDLKDFYEDDYEEITPQEILKLEVPKPKKSIKDLYPLSGFRVLSDGEIYEIQQVSPYYFTELWNTLPSKDEAKAYKILPMLLQFRDRYNENWKPNYLDGKELKFVIEVRSNNLETNYYRNTQYLFAFKTQEIRNNFLNDFRDELEIVKPLL